MIDYKQGENNDCDLDFSAGDLQYTESTGQHQRDLILADKGHIRDSPECGVGSINYIQDEDREDYLRTVRKELSKDGQRVKSIYETETGQIIIDAEYEEN